MTVFDFNIPEDKLRKMVEEAEKKEQYEKMYERVLEDMIKRVADYVFKQDDCEDGVENA